MVTHLKLVLSTAAYLLVCWHCLAHQGAVDAARRPTPVTTRRLALHAAPSAVAPPRAPAPPFAATPTAARSAAPEGPSPGDAPLDTAQALQHAFDRALAGRTIQFAPGSDQITPDSLPLVAQLAALLLRAPRWRVEVAGHTDATGNPEVNVDMSARRAAVVARLLAERGVSFRRIRVIGKGDTRPVADNASAEGRARNRRIQITVLREG